MGRPNKDQVRAVVKRTIESDIGMKKGGWEVIDAEMTLPPESITISPEALETYRRITNAALFYVAARRNIEAPTGSPLEAQIRVDAAWAALVDAVDPQ